MELWSFVGVHGGCRGSSWDVACVSSNPLIVLSHEACARPALPLNQPLVLEGLIAIHFSLAATGFPPEVEAHETVLHFMLFLLEVLNQRADAGHCIRIVRNSCEVRILAPVLESHAMLLLI